MLTTTRTRSQEKNVTEKTPPAEATDDWKTLGLNIYPFTITDMYVRDIMLLAEVFGRTVDTATKFSVKDSGHPIVRYGITEYRDGPKARTGKSVIAPDPPGISLFGLIDTPDRSVVLLGKTVDGKNISIRVGSDLGEGWEATLVTREVLEAVFRGDKEFTCSFDVREKMQASLSTQPVEEEEGLPEWKKRELAEEKRREALAQGKDKSEKTDRKFTPGEVRTIWGSL